MTLVAVWVRENGPLHEVVLASDSRISGGEFWNACPKIIPLPRPATAVAMSGDAVEAYAFLIQAINTCHLLDGHINGRTDIGNLASTLRKVYGDSRTHVTNLPFGQKLPATPDLNVALVGWSWRNLAFEAYSYTYNKHGHLTMRRMPQLELAKAYGVYFLGDGAKEANRRLTTLIKQRSLPRPRRGDPEARAVARSAFLDWEPLEILLDVIDDERVPSVGGVPQVLRIYQYGHTECFVWRDEKGVDFFGGRPVLATERSDRRVLRFADGAVEVLTSDRSIASHVVLPASNDDASSPQPPG